MFGKHRLTNVQVYSFGANDDAALGRITMNVPDPENEGKFLDVDELASVPHPVQSLLDENFRAVKIACGDSISAAISDAGELRVWGTFRVSLFSLSLLATGRLTRRAGQPRRARLLGQCEQAV
jgi:regulator of chromosome condensation